MKLRFLVFVLVAAIIALTAFFLTPSASDDVESDGVPDSIAHSAPDLDSAGTFDGNYRLFGKVSDGLSHKGLAANIAITANGGKSTASCNSSGEYAIDVDASHLSITASLDGYVAKGKNDALHELDIGENADNPYDIELWPEAKVVGRITNDGEGFPASVKLSYKLDASGAANYDFKSIAANDNGDFAFDMAYAGSANLSISADGFPAQTLSDIVLEPGKTVDLGEIPMLHGVSLYGSVFNSKTQQPIPNAHLQLVENNDEVLSEATSDKNGEYIFPAIVQDKIRIKTVAAGYHDGESVISFDGTDLQAYVVYLTPIEGISLTVNNITQREPILTTVTATDVKTDKIVYKQMLENGTYDLKQLTEGPYFFTAVSSDGETTATGRATSGDAISLTLKPFGRINVQLFIDDSNADYSKAEYRYIYKNEEGEQNAVSWIVPGTDSFMINDLKPGTYIIEARAKSYFSHISTSRPIYIDMGSTEFLKLTLTENKSLRFKIKNTNGHDFSKGRLAIIDRDAKNVTVIMYNYSSKSDNIEALDFNVKSTLPPGNFTLMLESADGYVAAFNGSSKGDDTDINMTLDLSSARKETSSGNSLSFDVLKLEYTTEDASEEEKKAAQEKQLEVLKAWISDIDEQVQYQLNAE